MNNNNSKTNTVKATTKQEKVPAKQTPKAKAIKLGIDVHADRYVVARQIDGNAPQPA